MFSLFIFQIQMSLFQLSKSNSPIFINKHKIWHRKKTSKVHLLLFSFTGISRHFFFMFISLTWGENIQVVWDWSCHYSPISPSCFWAFTVHNECIHLHRDNEMWWIVEKPSFVEKECHTCLWNGRNLTLSRQESHSISIGLYGSNFHQLQPLCSF